MLAKIKAKQEEQKSKSSAKSAKQALATYEEAFDKWFLGQANEYVEYIEEAVSVLGVVKDPPAFSPERREVGLIVKLRSGLCGRLEFSVLDSSATTSQSNPDGDPIVVSALDELSLEYSQVATNQPCPEGSRDGISELPVDASLTDKLIRDMRYVTDQLGYPEFYTMDLVITDTHENFGELKDGLLKYDVIDVTALVRDHKGRCFRTKQNLKYITKGPKSAIAKHLYNDSEMDIRTFNLTGDRFHEGNQLKCPIERELGQVDGQKNASLAIDFTEAEREVREYYKRMRPEDIVVRLLPENTGDPFVHNQLNGEENYAERRVNFLVVRTNRRCELVDLLFRVPLIYDVTALEGYRKVGDFRLHSGAGWGNEVSCAQWGVSDQLLDQAEEAFIKAASWSKEKQAIAAMNRAFAIVSTATVGMKAEELVSELKETL